MLRRAGGPILVAALACLALARPALVGDSAWQPADPGIVPVPGARLPVVKTHRYRMAGRIRPLLFWIGRDNVGLAQITWRGGDEARAYEFLVGTDPRIAPRGINRWGDIREEALAGGGSLLALMSRSDEASYDDARANTERRATGGEFRAIQATLHEGVATSRTALVATDTAATIHDVERMLDRVQAETARATARTTRLDAGTRPGFLLAVAELVDRSVGAAQSPGAALGRLTSVKIPYVFNQKRYEVRLRAVSPVPVAAGWRGRVREAVRGDFEILTLATGARTRFEMTYAVKGEWAGVPLEIEWQPRWWLKIELHLLAG